MFPADDELYYVTMVTPDLEQSVDRQDSISGWKGLSLLSQFALMGAVVLVIGMAVIGFWVTDQIKGGVTRNTATSTALFMRSFIEPVVQDLAHRDVIDPETRELLDELLSATEISRRIVSFKIWKEDGLVVYSSKHDIIGQKFPETDNLREAWRGQVTAEFDSLEDEEDALERAAGIPLLEMYSPVRQNRTGRIVAVAEFYEQAEDLHNNLFRSVLTSWLVVGTVTLLMFGALSGIVMRGSHTIDRQRKALEQQVSNLSLLLQQNEELRIGLQRASRRTTEISERFLRRISADLHDGPAQLLAFALLRIDSLRRQLPRQKDHTGQDDIDLLRSSMADALEDVRAICNGLTLPELNQLSPPHLIRSVAEVHERRTGSKVEVLIESAPETLSQPYKICVYRFVQETLNNAFRYAGGQDQKVTLRYTHPTLEVEVSDQGGGFKDASQTNNDHGLGLPGLRERIESLGGSMEIKSTAGEGTRVIMYCEPDAQIEEE